MGWRASTAACACWRGWPCRVRSTSSPSLLQLQYFWLEVDALLRLFGADAREPIGTRGSRRADAAWPPACTYISSKTSKKRWGHGQEDVYPVAQYEKLWGDMTALPEWECLYLAVPRLRGQQLKEPAQLDGWYRDGSREYVEGLCAWE